MSQNASGSDIVTYRLVRGQTYPQLAKSVPRRLCRTHGSRGFVSTTEAANGPLAPQLQTRMVESRQSFTEYKQAAEAHKQEACGFK